MELYNEHSVDGIMIGRGIFENPFAFSARTTPPTRQELLDLFYLHLAVHDAQDQVEARKFDPLKRSFKIYIKGFPGASSLRHQLMQTKTTAEARALVNKAIKERR